MHHNTGWARRRRLAGWLALWLASALTLLSCGGRLPDRGSVSAAAGEPLVLAVISTSSGPLSGEGEGVAQAVRMAVADHGTIRGWPVEVRVLEGGCDPEQAERAVELLVADPRVIGVVGPLCSPACVTAEVAIADRAVVMVTPRCSDVAVTRQGYPNVLRTVYSDSFNAAAAARLANDVLDVDSVFLIHDGTLYGRGMRDVFKFVYGKQNLAGNVEALPGNGYAAVIRAVQRSHAGLIFYAGFPEHAAVLLQELRAAGVRLPVVLPDTALAPPGLPAIAGAAAEGVYITEAVPVADNRAAAFAAAYQQRHQQAPPPYAAEAYDAAAVVLRAADDTARRHGDTVRMDRRALQEAARDVRLAGASGAIAFRRNGDRREGVSARLLQVTDGVLVQRRLITLDD